MKALIICILSGIYTCSTSQNWQLFNSTRLDWFNSESLAFDSVREESGDTIFYIKKLIREDMPICFSYTQHPIIANLVRAKLDGTYIFTDVSGITYTIYSLAPKRSSWVAANLPNGAKLEMHVDTVYSNTILSIKDSIKVFSIYYKDSTGNITGGKSERWLLSKNHGIKQWVSLDIHDNMETVLYRQPFKRLTYRDVHNFLKGDEYQWERVGQHEYTFTRFIKVLKKMDSADQVRYTFDETFKFRTYHFINDSTFLSPEFKRVYDTTFYNLDTYVYDQYPQEMTVHEAKTEDTITLYHFYRMRQDVYEGVKSLLSTYDGYPMYHSNPDQFCALPTDRLAGGELWRYNWTEGIGRAIFHSYINKQSLAVEEWQDVCTWFKKDTVTWGNKTDLSVWEPPSLAHFFVIYPNPASDKITIQCAAGPVSFHVACFNLQGKLVFESLIANNEQIDVNNLSDGIYFLRISIGNRMFTEKIVISKGF